MNPPTFDQHLGMAQWVRHLATDPVVKGSSPAIGHNIIRYALLINNPNKLNLLSWLLVYLYNK